MITRDNLQDVISEAQRRFVDDGIWKDLVVAETAKIRNEVEDVTRRAQAEFHQHGDGRESGRRTSAEEIITNKMSKMQDLEKELERTKRTFEALYARPTGSPEDPAQAPQGVSSDGGTGMLGRIREALARGEQPQASGPNVDDGAHDPTLRDYSKMFDHRMAENNPFEGKMKAEEWIKKTRNFFLGRCWPIEWMLEWARFGRSATVVCQAKARSLSGWSRTSTAWKHGGA